MTECSRCGDCCERIWLAEDALWRIAERAPLSREDVNSDVEYWMARGDEAAALRVRANHLDASFIARHWTVVEEAEGGAYHSCDRFDRETRLCTAHDERPPICQGYPWYGHDPQSVVDERGIFLSPRCSFLEDVKVEIGRIT